MHRAKLKNKFNHDPSDKNRKNYKKHKNFCVNLVRREKKKYYENLDIKVFEDNKTFWRSVKPLLSNKVIMRKNMTLIENNKVISEKREIAEIMNNHFIDAVENLETETFPILEDIQTSLDDIDNIINKYKLHPSIVMIKNKVKVDTKFNFSDVTDDDTYKNVQQLDPNKGGVVGDIPAKVLIGSNDIITTSITKMFNDSVSSHIYPKAFKEADVTPIHKEKATTCRKNYRPLSLNIILSKVYERNMYSQIFSYFEQFLSPYMFGYRKGYTGWFLYLAHFKM